MSYNEDLQNLVHEYQRIYGVEHVSTAEVAQWALDNGRWKPRPTDMRARLAADISKALRQDSFIDKQGRKVRLMHAVSNREGQKVMTFWHDIRYMSRENMSTSLQQRRNGIVSDCLQHKTDQDSFNDNHNPGIPIQTVYDFRDDLIEIELARKKKKSA